jgi:hypothetical protein
MSDKHKKFLRKVGIKEREIHLGMVDMEIVFATGKEDNLAEYIAYKFETKEEKIEIGSAYGYCFYCDGYCPIIWLPRYPKTPRELGTLSHECFHASMHVARWLNMPVEEKNEEVIAHCIRFLVQNFLKLMK